MSPMAFYFYRRYVFKNVVKTKWEALAIAKQAEHDGMLSTCFDGEWVQVIDDSGGWVKSFKKQFLGK